MTLAREVAARVLERVVADGSFAAAVLEAELTRRVQMDARERALATELVYGTLRIGPWLTAELDRFAPRGTAKLDARVRAQLQLAAYQLFFTRVPAFAAVHEAVGAVRAARGDRLAAFANAVLRKLAARAASFDEQAQQAALVSATPAWLRDALGRALGAEGAHAFLSASTASPPVGLRIERAEERDAWLARLREAAPDAAFEAGRISPLAVVARGAGRTHALPGWREGAWSIQEEGSQGAALAVGARSGESILDACAGRGNKTAILARAVGPTGAVDACDALPAKLERLREELGRLRLEVRRTHAVDWRAGAGDVTGTYDRVLVDAPCSGIGTLRRRPEILLRREALDLPEFARTQVAIATRAAGQVRPGGTLVYVVCSVFREEGEDVIDALLDARPELEPAPFDAQQGGGVVGASGAAGASRFRLLPHVHGTDGYFVAQLRSRGPTL